MAFLQILTIFVLALAVIVLIFSVINDRKRRMTQEAKLDSIETDLWRHITELKRHVFHLEDRHFLREVKQYVGEEYRVIVTVNPKNSLLIGLDAIASEGTVVSKTLQELERDKYVLHAYLVTGRVRVFNRTNPSLGSISLRPDSALTYIYQGSGFFHPELLPGNSKEFNVIPGGANLFSGLLRTCSVRSL